MITGKTLQLLTFTLAGETYALDVGSAREVVEYSRVTPIPKTPEWICGVLNLRGAVVPVLDLKQKLEMEATERTRDTCILILEIELDAVQTLVGVLADSVREVIEVETSEIEPPPRFGARVSTKYVRGMGRRNKSLFVVLDVSKVFASDELELVQEVAAVAPESLPSEFDDVVAAVQSSTAESVNAQLSIR